VHRQGQILKVIQRLYLEEICLFNSELMVPTRTIVSHEFVSRRSSSDCLCFKGVGEICEEAVNNQYHSEHSAKFIYKIIANNQ
jgi:hypothetical protein